MLIAAAAAAAASSSSPTAAAAATGSTAPAPTTGGAARSAPCLVGRCQGGGQIGQGSAGPLPRRSEGGRTGVPQCLGAAGGRGYGGGSGSVATAAAAAAIGSLVVRRRGRWSVILVHVEGGKVVDVAPGAAVLGFGTARHDFAPTASPASAAVVRGVRSGRGVRAAPVPRGWRGRRGVGVTCGRSRHGRSGGLESLAGAPPRSQGSASSRCCSCVSCHAHGFDLPFFYFHLTCGRNVAAILCTRVVFVWLPALLLPLLLFGRCCCCCACWDALRVD